jgi:putative membrane protein
MRNRILGAALAAVGLIAAFGCDRKDDHRMSQKPDQDNYSGNRTGTPYTEPQDTQKSESPQNRVAQQWDSADRTFMMKAAQANLAEVEAGRLAGEKSTNSDVKKFAQMMVDDHSQANEQLTDLAQKKNISLPNEPDDAHKKDAGRLSDLKGAEFDRSYMTMMVQDHVKAVALFEATAKAAKDSDVRAFAEKTIPVLKHHLDMARDLNNKVSGPTGAD